MQMSHLPYGVSPTGYRDSLGWVEKQHLIREYPQRRFPTGRIPIACPPAGIRIYETGNSENPNVYSAFGVVTADDIRY